MSNELFFVDPTLARIEEPKCYEYGTIRHLIEPCDLFGSDQKVAAYRVVRMSDTDDTPSLGWWKYGNGTKHGFAASKLIGLDEFCSSLDSNFLSHLDIMPIAGILSAESILANWDIVVLPVTEIGDEGFFLASLEYAYGFYSSVQIDLNVNRLNELDWISRKYHEVRSPTDFFGCNSSQSSPEYIRNEKQLGLTSNLKLTQCNAIPCLVAFGDAIQLEHCVLKPTNDKSAGGISFHLNGLSNLPISAHTISSCSIHSKSFPRCGSDLLLRDDTKLGSVVNITSFKSLAF